MSYRTEEQKIQKRLRRIKIIVFAVVFFIVLFVCIFSAFVPPTTWKYYFHLPKVAKRQEGELRLHFLDVGQGDCTLIELPDGKTVLVDGGDGEEAHTSTLMRYLNALKIEYLDFVVLTHTDSDHCGGLSTVLQYKKVGTVCHPQQENITVNTAYASFYATVGEKGLSTMINSKAVSIVTSDARYPYRLQWLSPSVEAEGDGNENSAVLFLHYGEKRALLMGDASTEVEDALMTYGQVGLLSGDADIADLDLLKVSHHGSSANSQTSFLQYTKPKTAVISCGKDNQYGHPAVETLERLYEVNATVCRTDEQGTLLFSWKAAA